MKQAAIALIIKDGLILSISRRHDPSKFGLIGGKVDSDETLERALVREVYEETSVIVQWAHEFFHRVEPSEKSDDEDFECYCFYVPDWKGVPKSMEEGTVSWLTQEELTGSKAAFGDYNRNMLAAFKEKFPEVLLIGE